MQSIFFSFSTFLSLVVAASCAPASMENIADDAASFLGTMNGYLKKFFNTFEEYHTQVFWVLVVVIVIFILWLYLRTLKDMIMFIVIAVFIFIAFNFIYSYVQKKFSLWD